MNVTITWLGILADSDKDDAHIMVRLFDPKLIHRNQIEKEATMSKGAFYAWIFPSILNYVLLYKVRESNPSPMALCS